MNTNLQQVDDFINADFLPYAVYDCQRSIPSMVDGMKVSQRKIIHTVLKTLKEGVDIKVTNLGSAASNETHYKHGEDSIVDTVVGLAQDFAGSNNYPLLEKEGQFGTAIDNDAANPRYIHVRRSKLLTQMFDQDDLNLVEYQLFDDEIIEPKFFLPKMPLIVINGGFGIGTGYSSNILPRCPKNVKKYMEQVANGSVLDSSLLLPHFNGFKGTVERIEKNKFMVKGLLERSGQTTSIIKDLPPFSSFQFEKYKVRVLLPLLDAKKITGFDNESTEGNWHIVIHHSRDFGKQTPEKIASILKMNQTFTENITVWGFDNRMKNYGSIEELMTVWINERFKYLDERKQHILQKMDENLDWYRSLMSMIKYWLENPSILKKKRSEIEMELATLTENTAYIKKFLESDILSLTQERIDKTQINLDKIIKDRSDLQMKTSVDIMLSDLMGVTI